MADRKISIALKPRRKVARARFAIDLTWAAADQAASERVFSAIGEFLGQLLSEDQKQQFAADLREALIESVRGKQ